MNPFFSIIIPVYKVEQYISQCIDSVLAQRYHDFEVILIDDGSTDKCPQICDEYALKDNRIIVFHKTNGGSSDARNYGMRVSKGDYLMFLDSDDYWGSENCLQNIVERLNKTNPDVLLYGCMDYFMSKNQIKISRTGYDLELIRNSSKNTVLKYYFESGLFPGSAWTNVVKRKFILENDLFFIKGIKAEDIDWLLNVYLAADSYDAVNDTFYIYLKHRNDSITGTADTKSFDDVLFTIKKWVDKMQSPQYEDIRDHVLSHLAYQLTTLYISLNKLPEDKRKIKIHELKYYSFLFSRGKQKKIQWVKVLNRFLGVKRTAAFLSFLYKLKYNEF